MPNLKLAKLIKTENLRLTKKEFVYIYGDELLNELVEHITTWIIYAADQKKEIKQALNFLADNRDATAKLMDLTIPARIYRGIGITADDELNSLEVAEPFIFEQLHPVESWSTYKSALSFANSTEWLKNFGHKDIGLVLTLLKPKENVAVLAPAHKTEKWFNDMLNKELTKKAKEDRKGEDEYLISGQYLNAVIVKKIEL